MKLVWCLAAGAAVVGSALLSAGAAESAGAATSESKWVSYGPPKYPQPLSELPPSTQDLARRASELVDWHKSDFLGSFVDDTGSVVLLPSSDAGRKFAEETVDEGPERPVLLVADLSLEAAQELGDRVNALTGTWDENAFMWGAAPESNGAFVEVMAMPSESDAALLSEFAERAQTHIDVVVDPQETQPILDEDRYEDYSPYAGGARYGISSDDHFASSTPVDSRCSIGFGYVRGGNDYLLTAGHCFPGNRSYHDQWAVNGWVPVDYAGHNSLSTWDNGTGTVAAGSDNAFHGDLSLTNLANNREAGDQIWWDGASSPNKIPVVDRSAPTSGDDLCINGWASGADCGITVTLTNVRVDNYNNPGVTLRNGDAAHSFSAADCSKDGDSGGSIVINHNGPESNAHAVGIVSGHDDARDGGCIQFFTGVEEGMQ